MTSPVGAEPGVVIVGAGIAGITAAETLRADGYDGPVTVLGSESHPPYRRTALSKDMFRADLDIDRIRLRADEYWTERGIEIRGGVTVTEIDVDAHRVRCDDGTAIAYRKLVLATGGQARVPDTMRTVPSLRDRSDVDRIRTHVADSDAVVIVGAGLIGLELAASAAGAGMAVSVFDVAPLPMARVVPPVISEYLADVHRANGVNLNLDARLDTVAPDRVVSADGTVAAGAVLVATGLVPDIDLAMGAGLDTDPAGIAVDECLRTSAADIYAAGDVVALPNLLGSGRRRHEHWMAATEQGRSVARSIVADLAGEQAPIHRDVPLAWTTQYGTNIQVAGDPTAGSELRIDGVVADGDATVTAHLDGRLVGGVALGRPRAGRELRAAMLADLPVVSTV